MVGYSATRTHGFAIQVAITPSDMRGADLIGGPILQVTGAPAVSLPVEELAKEFEADP